MKVFVALTLLSCVSLSAHSFNGVHGKVSKLYSESGQFNFTVSENATPQQCGGFYFKAVKSELPHFENLYALTLAALTAKQSVEIVIKRCDGDRAVVDHMAIY